MTSSNTIKAGERAYTVNQREQQNVLCREYRACKQRKQRQHNKKCIEDIKNAYNTNRSVMWQVINRLSHSYSSASEPSDQKFIIISKTFAYRKVLTTLVTNMKPWLQNFWNITMMIKLVIQ